MCKIELISIGNELLNGFTVNTNVSWLGQQLTRLGYDVKWGTTIPDIKDYLENAFAVARSRADIILVTGGLGPTHDDITKSVICSYFKLPLVFNEKAMKNVEAFFARRNRQMSEVGRMQAYIPDGALALENSIGTASGIALDVAGALFIFMPGVPSEMKSIMTNEGFDYIKTKFPADESHVINFKTTGIYESRLSDKISDLISNADSRITISFLPKITGVTLRLVAPAAKKKVLFDLASRIKSIIKDYIYTEENKNLEDVVGHLLLEQNKTVAIAESCTGGLISHLLTNISGSSSYIRYNQVTYSNEAKIKELGVSQKTLELLGAVSDKVAQQMAEKIRAKFDSDFGIGITGIAGPEGGTEDKPVGLVFAALAIKNKKTIVRKFIFGNDRETNKLQSAVAAMEMLRRELLGI